MQRKKGHTLLHGESVGSACYLSMQPNLHRVGVTCMGSAYQEAVASRKDIRPLPENGMLRITSNGR